MGFRLSLAEHIYAKMRVNARPNVCVCVRVCVCVLFYVLYLVAATVGRPVLV